MYGPREHGHWTGGRLDRSHLFLKAGERYRVLRAFTDYDGMKPKIDHDGVTGDHELPAVLVGHNVTFAGQFGRFIPADLATSKITATAQDLSGATFTKEVGVGELFVADPTKPDGGLPAGGKTALRPIFLGDYSAAAPNGTIRLHRDLRNNANSQRVSTKPAKAIAKTARYGAGVKGKVNLAMSHGLPVVATSASVEGMHLSDGEDVLVADDPEAFAGAVGRAYEDRALWERLSAGGRANIERHFSRAVARTALEKLLA